MTVEEIKAKHQPRQLENQVEFDAIMSDINQQQGELNRPLIDRKMAIVKQRELLNIQKQAINQQLSALLRPFGSKRHPIGMPSGRQSIRTSRQRQRPSIARCTT